MARLGRSAAAFVFTIALVGAHAQPVAGIATEVPGPGQVQLLANCFDACTVNVVLNGNGSGTWKSTNSQHVPNGLINCTWLNGAQAPGSDCTEVYCCVDRVSQVRVYFTLTPSTGSEACYQDACAGGTGVDGFQDLPSTNQTITTTIGGTFKLLEYPVAISRAGSAANSGVVGISPGGITCPPSCLATSVAYGTQFTLTAVAAEGSYFDHWSGACQGQPAVCSLTVTGPIDTTATFTLGSPPTASPPAVTPGATPKATPKATVKPTATPRTNSTSAPNATPAPLTTSQPTTGTSPTAATETGAPGSEVPGTRAPATSDPLASLVASPTPTEPPAVPAVAASDLTPIALAILGAGLLIAIGIGTAGFVLTRRRSGAPPS